MKKHILTGLELCKNFKFVYNMCEISVYKKIVVSHYSKWLYDIMISKNSILKQNASWIGKFL